MRDASNNRIQCLVLDHQCVFGISCQNGREKMVKQQIKQKAPATCMYTYAPQHVLSVVHLFGSWMQDFRWDSKKIIFTSLCALLWSIWLSRNDVVFHNIQRQTVLQILFRATHLTRTWAILQKEEYRGLIADACRALEVTAMDIFARNGWQFSNRLCGLYFASCLSLNVCNKGRIYLFDI